MKYLIILTLFLTGCFPDCPKKWREDLQYNSRVIVTDGFFKGETGLIKGQVQIYRSDECNLEGFKVELESDKKIVEIEQTVLVKKPAVAPVVKCDGYPFCELPK